jgi:hypothetical protein
MIKKWISFNEKLHVNGDVKHLTNIIYNKIYQLLPNLIIKKEIIIKNLLQDNYSRIKFKGDVIKIKIGSNHGVVKTMRFNNGVIDNLNMEFKIGLSKEELKNKYLIKNRIKETINHESQHIVEFYHTGGVLPESWDFNSRLKKHEDRFTDFCKKININPDDWLNITHMFYLCEEHEIRSNVSSTHEYFKNKDSSNVEEHIKKRKEFKDYKLISTENAKLILSNMYRIYTFFNSVLDDFIKNVILNQNSNLGIVFNKEFDWVKKRASECCRKMLSISANFQTTNESDRNLIDSKIMDRDIKLNLILDKNKINEI